MRLLLIFAVVTLLCVYGLDRLMYSPVVSMDHWVCEPRLKQVLTNNGTFYYSE